eukprot:8649388-Lingulodinium_polyedra.AAC.1
MATTCGKSRSSCRCLHGRTRRALTSARCTNLCASSLSSMQVPALTVFSLRVGRTCPPTARD